MAPAFRIFFRASGSRSILVLSCLVIGTILELIGFGAMIPLFAIGETKDPADLPELGRIAIDAFQLIGLVPNPVNLIIFIITTLLLKNLGSFLAMTYAGYARAEVVTDIRHRMLSSVFLTSWAYLVRRRPGRLVNEISQNAHRAGDAYMASAGFFTYLVPAILYLVGAFLVSTSLTAIGLVVGLAAFLLFSRIIRLSRRAGQGLTDTTNALTAELTDVLNNIKPIKAMNRQEQITALFTRRINVIRGFIRRQETYHFGLERSTEAFITVAIGVGFYIATIHMNVALPELIVIGIFAIKGLETLRTLLSRLRFVGEYESAYFSTADFIADLMENQEQNTGEIVPELHTACRFEKVDFSYDGKPVIENVSFSIKAGEITVLLGPSGAGKTSLVDLLLGLHQPSSGEIYIDDCPLKNISLAAWRGMVGYVPQELTLLHGSIRDNITFGDDRISDGAVNTAISLAGADSFVNALPEKLDSNVGEMGSKLSGGERQRIALARALVSQPQVLILDEVTSALDPDTERLICDNIASLRGKYTILAITHRDAWKSIASAVYSVDQGKVQPAAASMG